MWSNLLLIRQSLYENPIDRGHSLNGGSLEINFTIKFIYTSVPSCLKSGKCKF